MECFVSVIIPVYNTEAYLGSCLTSVTNQSYSNLEIIIIDDGSDDTSGRIADEFAGKDGRIRVIHQENRGIAEARNVGLREATGEWIFFVDSDDEVLPDAIQRLLSLAEQEQTNISMGGYRECICREGKILTKQVHVHNRVYREKERMFQYFLSEGRNFNFLWQKLYHKSVFQSLAFEKGKYYEDLLLLPDILEAAGSIAIMDVPVYSYRLRKGSITGSKSMNVHMDGLYARTRWMAHIQKQYPDLVPVCADAILEYCCYMLGKMAASGSEKDSNIREEVLDVFRRNQKIACKNNMYLHVASRLFSISPVFLGFLCGLYSKIKRNLIFNKGYVKT